MKVTIADVKKFAQEQMDAVWHDNSGTATVGMVKFTYKGYCVVNPWMNETTHRNVNPYKYYGRKRTNNFIKQATRAIQRREELAEQHHRR